MTTPQWAGIARLGGVGDNLIASSVLPGLRKKYGRVEVITQAPFHVIFENNPHVDKLAVHEAGDIPWGDGYSWHQWFQTRGKEYAFFANLSHTCESLRAYLKGQSEFWWPAEYRRKLASQSYLETVHDVCGLDYDCIAPDFFPTVDERASARDTKMEITRKYAQEHAGQWPPRAIAWILGGTRIDKVYPFAEIAVARIIKELGMPVILFGAFGRDFEFAKSIETDVKRHNGSTECLHLALSPDAEHPTWPLRRALSLVQACDLVIGPDTGPMWAVAMHKMPKVLLLSHAGIDNITKHWVNTVTLHADRKAVPCWPCHRLHDDASTCQPNESKTGPACLSDISVERLIVTVRAALKEG